MRKTAISESQKETGEELVSAAKTTSSSAITPDAPAESPSAEAIKASGKHVEEMPAANTKQVRVLITKFLVGWFFSLILIGIIAVSADIDWAKPFLQRGLSLIIHRNVRLGHLSWTWRPGNLTVQTAKVSINGADGSKLLLAGPSEVGLAFFPLLKKKVIVKHITLNRPEFWAVRVKDQGWNFDDLLTLGPDIQFFQANNGIIHLSDGADALHPKWQQLKLEAINVKFLFPQRNINSPLYVAFNLVKPKYTTKVIFTSFGGGPHDWQNNKYKFDTIISRLNVDDVAPFIQTVGHIKPAMTEAQEDSLHGLFNVQMSGEGVFDQGLKANLKVSSEKFSVDAEPFGIVSAPAESHAEISIDKQRLRWHDLVLKLANIQLNSNGEVADWKDASKSYDATVSGKINELQDIKQVIEKPESAAAKTIVGLENFKLSGNASIELSADKAGNKSSLTTTFDTNGLQIKPFLDQNAKHLSPIMKLLGLQDTALLTGKLEYQPNEQLRIVEGSLPIAGGVIKANGDFDLKQSSSRLNFTASDIHLATLRKSVEEASSFKGFLSHFFCLPKNKHLELGGVINAGGVLDTKSNATVGEGSGTFKNAVIAVTDGTLNARNMKGSITWRDRKLNLRDIEGTVGNGGSFVLQGLADLKGTPFIDWSIKAKHLDLAQLSTLMHLMRIDVPLFSQGHLTGTVSSLDLKVTGPRDRPNISFTAVPENMLYQPPGLSRPLEAVSGLIVYKNDNLSLTNVAFVTHGDQVQTTFTIQQLSHNAKLTDLSLKTKGIDLSDVHFYLSSSLMPEPLKRVYLGFLKDNKIFDVHGRTSADVACKFNGDKVALSGTAKLDDVEAKIIQPGMLVKHLFGEVIASGDNLILKKIRGRYRDAAVFIDGKVLNYANADPTYNMHVSASLKPDELVQMLPPAKDQLDQWHLELRSQHALDVNCEYAGNSRSTRLQFVVKAEPAAKMELSTRFGDFYQPPSENVLLDGVFLSDAHGIAIKDAHVQIGTSTVQIEGQVGEKGAAALAAPSDTETDASSSPVIATTATADATSETTEATRASSRTMSWEGRPIRIQITSNKPVAVAHLLSTLDPTIKLQDITGNLTGKVVLDGKIPDLSPSGEVHLSQISIPSWKVHDLNGTVKMLGLNPQHLLQPIAQLAVPLLNIGPLTAKNCKVDLALEAPEDDPGAGLIKITGANADIVGGKAELSGTVDLKQRDMQMVVHLTNVSAAEVTEKLFKRPHQISGDVDMRIDVGTHGKNLHEVISNFAGDGDVEISNGAIRKMGHLQTELTRVNLLHQGLFGLNWSSFWQSVLPSKSGGVYKTVSGQFKFDKQTFSLEQFKYSSLDMCLWASGRINLANSTCNMAVAGNIPRVSRGTVAGVSRAVRLTNFVNVATLGMLKNFPALPIIGELNPDRSRTFEFKLNSPVDEPRAITQSAERTFHWLPSRPTASAHPVLGVFDVD